MAATSLKIFMQKSIFSKNKHASFCINSMGNFSRGLTYFDEFIFLALMGLLDSLDYCLSRY